MKNPFLARRLPHNLDPRLKRRDTTPLAEGALVRFQLISRAKNPGRNYRWVLYEDGRWFLARHSGQVVSAEIPFDTELPAQPTSTLSAAVVATTRKLLEAEDFLRQPPYQAEAVKDGSFYVVTARLSGRVHEVIYEAVSNPLTTYLRAIISSAESEHHPVQGPISHDVTDTVE